ncbi:metal-sulfur cluster assembly factor [Lederbergia panacisoli]|uniref:metal-sulfur cluster assembly factor n=1 Tax=Lederbergia panacisoli TaxID=1255251 RepID=UPI00214B5D5C|nr:metal-sulfur cluster assembly factor [Lederbergia panacisoli]MCR2822550.1 metal-sulfur cluster assembly factor [Lederbergia panacisoli]
MEMEEHIEELLRYVYDPELGINIVDLGLVYDIQHHDGHVYIKMTLTTPGCPMHDTIVGGVKYVLKEKLETEDVEIDLVWEPKWSPEMISREGKDILGIR